MKRVTGSHGFTIVETLIFLAVSGVLFASAMLVVTGQQAKTEFRQGAGELRSQLDDTANDVATGYRTANASTRCTVSGTAGTPPSITVATTEQGTNLGCIVVGRSIQLQSTKTTTYSVVGRRLVGATTSLPTQSLAEAAVVLPTNNQLIVDRVMPFGLRVYSAYYQDTPSSAKLSIHGYAIVSSLASYSSNGQLQPGNPSVELIPIPGGSAGNIDLTATDFSNTAATYLRSPTAAVSPSGGITMCVDSAGQNQHVILRISAGVGIASTMEYRTGSSAANTAECAV